jgi:hypothetical protein
MKRLFSIALLGVSAALLAGCPVYGGDDSSGPTPEGACPGDSYWTCNNTGGCWCESVGYDAGLPSNGVDATVPTSCTRPGDCPAGYTCGAAGECELGDCSVTGCVSGYVCELENGTLQCVGETPPPPVDAGPPDTGFDSGVACQSNADCPTGDLCLDGTCVPPGNQCYDGTQCPTGDKCVAGACTPACQTSTDGGVVSCPTGYACTDIDDASSSGVCTGNPTPCESNPTVCPTGTVCSQDHCVSPCGSGDSCPSGEVCIQGGCVPNQLPNFECTTDGVEDNCAVGSICLHHSCYIACNPDGGASSCQSADQFNECKPVTASGSTYYVCGSSTNLGNECDPTDGQECSNSAAVCIDGFCH